MKKLNLHLSVLVLLAAILTVNAQSQTQIPNGKFNNWDSPTKPKNWSPSNIDTTYMSLPINIVTVTEDTISVTPANYAVKLNTKSVTLPSMPPITLPGFITLGSYWFSISQMSGGFFGGIPFTSQPDSIVGRYKYSVASKDTALIYVLMWRGELYKGTNIIHDSNILALNTDYITATTNNWTRFSFPVQYYTKLLTPDSLNIVVSSSNILHPTNMKAGSTLQIDSLMFVYNSPNSINPSTVQQSLKIYPNPATSLLNVEIPGLTNKGQFTIYNMQGKLIKTYQITNLKSQLDISELTTGLYIYKYTGINNQFTGIFTKE